MPAIIRVGDTGSGTCTAPSHSSPVACTVVFTTGAPTVGGSGSAICTVGSLGITSCGHHTLATTGSPTVTADGQPVHREGDVGIIIEGGSYTATSGSPTVTAN